MKNKNYATPNLTVTKLCNDVIVTSDDITWLLDVSEYELMEENN